MKYRWLPRSPNEGAGGAGRSGPAANQARGGAGAGARGACQSERAESAPHRAAGPLRNYSAALPGTRPAAARAGPGAEPAERGRVALRDGARGGAGGGTALGDAARDRLSSSALASARGGRGRGAFVPFRARAAREAPPLCQTPPTPGGLRVPAALPARRSGGRHRRRPRREPRGARPQREPTAPALRVPAELRGVLRTASRAPRAPEGTGATFFAPRPRLRTAVPPRPRATAPNRLLLDSALAPSPAAGAPGASGRTRAIDRGVSLFPTRFCSFPFRASPSPAAAPHAAPRAPRDGLLPAPEAALRPPGPPVSPRRAHPGRGGARPGASAGRGRGGGPGGGQQVPAGGAGPPARTEGIHGRPERPRPAGTEGRRDGERR